MSTTAAVPQYMRALERANEIRLGRAEIKRQVAAGRQGVIEVILDPPEAVLDMPIGDLLKALPRVGDYRASTLVRGICRPQLTLRRMGAHTRDQLCFRLDSYLQ